MQMAHVVAEALLVALEVKKYTFFNTEHKNKINHDYIADSVLGCYEIL